MYTHNQANGEGTRSIDYAGSYNVRILPNSEAKYSQKGNPSMNLNYQILDGSQAGRVISFDSFTDSENASWKIDRILNSINFPDGQQFPGDGLAGVVDALIGKNVRITTDWKQQSQGKNMGKWYPEVTDYTPIQQGVPSEPNTDRPRPQESNTTNGSMNTNNNTSGVPGANDAAFNQHVRQNQMNAGQQQNVQTQPKAQQQGFTANQMYGQQPKGNPFGGQEVNISDDDLPF